MMLGEAFPGILVSDRWSAYTFVGADRRQLCWAHLCRDFVKIGQRPGPSESLGSRLLEQTRNLFHLWHAFRKGELSRAALVEQTAPPREAIVALLTEGATLADADKTRRTCENLLKLQAALFAFVFTEGVEPTNNDGEREIRAYVLWRKKSFGTQGNRGSDFVESVLTAIATCRRQNRNALEYLSTALDRFLHGLPPPSLLPQPAPTS